MKEYDGKIRLVLKDLPLPFHDLARPAHEAARCAGSFGKYWAYHDRLFSAQPDFQREKLITYAIDLGLERETFARCLDDHRFAAAIDKDVDEARELGISATPTFIVEGQALVGAHPVETFRAAIDEALKRRQ